MQEEMRFILEWPIYKIKKNILSLHQNKQLILNPIFQRESVWQETDQAMLIDSILQNIPLPSILLWEEKVGNKPFYHVVDGKQRIETIIAFTRKKLPFTYSPNKVIRKHINKEWAKMYEKFEDSEISYKKLKETSKTMYSHFNNFSIPVVLIKEAKSLEDIRELFIRVNSTGMKLQPSEIRNAKFLKSDLLLEAKRISEIKKIANFFVNNRVFTIAQFKRMKVIEFVTELILSIKTKDVLDKKSSIDTMIESKTSKKSVKKYGNEVRSILLYIDKFINDKDNRLKSTRFKNTADLYALAFCLWKIQKCGTKIDDKNGANSAFKVLTELDKMLKTYSISLKEGKGAKALPEVAMRYQKTIASNTDSHINRTDRVKIIEKLITPFFSKKDSERSFSSELKELLWTTSNKKLCSLCNEPILSFDNLEIDHRIPHANCGITNLANAQIAHSKCNRSKGKKRRPSN
jgi:hypothetical protein